MNLLEPSLSEDTISFGDLSVHKYKLFHTNAPQAYDYGSTLHCRNRLDTRLILIPECDAKYQIGRYNSGGYHAVDITGNLNIRADTIHRLYMKAALVENEKGEF